MSCRNEDKGSTMTEMRVRGKVVGSVVVLTADEAGISVDEATEAELAEAMKEADVEPGVTVAEAFARLPPRKQTA